MQGKYFEELVVDAIYRHSFSRTVTEMDNVLFSSLTMNPQPLHIDEHFSQTTIHGQRIMNSLFTAALIGGMTVADLTLGTTLGNLGYERLDFPHPVYHGDTLRAETKVLKKKGSATKSDRGVVWFEHRGFNQNDVVICVCIRLAMMQRRPTG